MCIGTYRLRIIDIESESNQNRYTSCQRVSFSKRCNRYKKYMIGHSYQSRNQNSLIARNYHLKFPQLFF